MRILYGAASEGLGHAVRSAVVAEHLLSRGHSVTFAAGKSRASRYLGERFGDVVQVAALGNSVTRGKISPLRTALSNLVKLPLVGLSALSLAGLPDGKPDLVISDFEPCVARFATVSGIPLLAIDNIHFLTRCSHAPQLIGGVGGDRKAAAIAFSPVRRVAPNADHYFVTSFAGAPVSSPRTSLHLPILRPEILPRKPDGDHVLVYFNDLGHWNQIFSALSGVPSQRFIAYGSGVLTTEERGNVTLKPVGEDSFLADFLSSRAVIGGSGFTLMTEAIYAHKPLLTLPFEGHFEQILNANYLESLGLGRRARKLDPAEISSFLGELPRFERALSGVSHDGNRGLFSALDSALAHVEAYGAGVRLRERVGRLAS
jgi:uncharacterized protein (TIGR00661 family)